MGKDRALRNNLLQALLCPEAAAEGSLNEADKDSGRFLISHGTRVFEIQYKCLLVKQRSFSCVSSHIRDGRKIILPFSVLLFQSLLLPLRLILFLR